MSATPVPVGGEVSGAEYAAAIRKPPVGDTGSSDAGQPPWRRIGKRVLGYGLLILFAVFFIFPFMLALVTSVKTREQAANDPLALIPDPFTTRVFPELFGSGFSRAVVVSVVVTVGVTLGRVFLDSLAGYALARLDFPFRKTIFAIIVATLGIPGIVLAIPRFLVLGTLGMLNSWAGLIVPLAVDAFGIFLMRQFFSTIPKEMEEAARVDGASIWQTYFRVVLPLATPGLIALTILSFQGSWNEFLHPLIAASGAPDLRPLPVYLALLSGAEGQSFDAPLLLAASVLTTIPVAIVFFSFQRYFIQGVAASGVKG